MNGLCILPLTITLNSGDIARHPVERDGGALDVIYELVGVTPFYISSSAEHILPLLPHKSDKCQCMGAAPKTTLNTISKEVFETVDPNVDIVIRPRAAVAQLGVSIMPVIIIIEDLNIQ
jgi:hypothetical protein